MLETPIEKAFVRRVESFGGMALKFLSTTNGWPDRLVLMPGARASFAECKKHKGELRELQEYRRKQLTDLGYRVDVVNTMEKARQWKS